MELAIHQDDANVLLKEKNVLDSKSLEKYRVAGQVTQNTLQYILSLIKDSYHLNKTETPYTCQELCILGDSFLKSAIDSVYKNGNVSEKGIAAPVSIDVNDLVSGFSPELDDESEFKFTPGDIVTISLGAQIDGYTASVSHTVVIYPSSSGSEKPEGPLLGSKADAICAAHIATETIVALLGCALSPEKIPVQLQQQFQTQQVTGSLIRALVDSIATLYNCVIVPGSKIRRVRRFLAGQAEGIVAERDFKGVVWSEANQEENLISKAQTSTDLIVAEPSHQTKRIKTQNALRAIPTDDFVVVPGEVYSIDLQMASLSDFNKVGIVTLETVELLSGVNNRNDVFRSKPTIFIRDVIIKHDLKLKTSRQLLGKIDKQSVYPFKLSHISSSFPIDIKEANGEIIREKIALISKDLKSNRLGLAELSNRHLVKPKPIQVAKFIGLDKVLGANNNTGSLGFDASKPVLPGMELPLPNLGVSSLKLKSLLKHAEKISVAREQTTVVLVDELATVEGKPEVLRLTGGSKAFGPSWVHSKFDLGGQYLETIAQLDALAKDSKYGIKIRVCQPIKASENGGMQLD